MSARPPVSLLPAAEGGDLDEIVRDLRDEVYGAVDETVARRWLGGVRNREDDILTAGGWSVKLVKAELSNAMQTLERMGGRIGPGSKSGFWPEVFRLSESVGEQVQQLRTGDLELRRDQKNRVRLGASSQEIVRMERAIRWPGRYLPDIDLRAMERDAETAMQTLLSATMQHLAAVSSDDLRRASAALKSARARHEQIASTLAGASLRASAIEQCRPVLHAWLRSEAENEPWGEAVKGTGVPLRTADLRRIKAFTLIMEGLDRDGVVP